MMLMRTFILMTAMSLLALLVACNSQEANRQPGSTAQKTQAAQTSQAPQPVQPQNSLDSARRITAAELHKLWEKDEVLIVDTRNEPSFKQGHIRGSILIPANEFSSRADELPKSKMIVTYCT
jgi:predicted sulfurtransferase